MGQFSACIQFLKFNNFRIALPVNAGQQQRVSLARAVYSAPDIVLLDGMSSLGIFAWLVDARKTLNFRASLKSDVSSSNLSLFAPDPLSALDAGTSKIIFENLKSLLSGSATILVTHAAHFLSQVDRIMFVSGGRVQFSGTWKELLEDKTIDAIDHIRSSVQEDSNDWNPSGSGEGLEGRKSFKVGARASTLLSGKKIMTEEEREHGLSSLSTWLVWFKHAGGLPFILGHVFFMTIDRFTYVAVEYWIARWTEGAYDTIYVFGVEFAPQSDGFSAQGKYVFVFALLVVASVIATICRSEWVVTGGSRAARRVFLSMLTRVLRCPMSYFGTENLVESFVGQLSGRVLNHFSSGIQCNSLFILPYRNNAHGKSFEQVHL